MSTSTIDNHAPEPLNIFPNPATNNLNIETNSILNAINMWDISGTNVLSTESKKVDIQSLSPGVYFIEIETASGNYMRKILKE